MALPCARSPCKPMATRQSTPNFPKACRFLPPSRAAPSHRDAHHRLQFCRPERILHWDGSANEGFAVPIPVASPRRQTLAVRQRHIVRRCANPHDAVTESSRFAPLYFFIITLPAMSYDQGTCILNANAPLSFPSRFYFHHRKALRQILAHETAASRQRLHRVLPISQARRVLP